MVDFMEQAQETFVSESLDLLQDMETALNELVADPTNEELINSVFRAAHTIKGSAGLFGQDGIVAFTHRVENVLDRVRSGEVQITQALVDVLLECRDHTEVLIEAIDSAIDSATEKLGQELLAKLERQSGANPTDAAQAPSRVSSVVAAEPESGPVSREEGPLVENDNWHISLRFHQDVLRNGMDPLAFLRYLSTLGEIVNVATLVDSMPSAETMDPESCYLGMEISFRSDADKQAIMDVFEFIADESLVEVIPPRSKLSEYMDLIETLSENEDEKKLGELLVAVGALTTQELTKALTRQQLQQEETNGPPPRLGEILVEQHAVDTETVSAALQKQKAQHERKAKESRSIRVDAERLDQLINLVGELVIAGAGASLKARQLQDEDLQESVSLMARLVEEIRDRSLRLRMVPIAETFNRFNRVVRDVSKELDKSIKLEIKGGDTELDKSVVEKIGDPLTHLVRNSIDHGIESAEVRLARGKPEQGTVTLNAYHDSGNIVI